MRALTPSSMPIGQPEVIVDFSIEQGRLSVHLKNIGQRAAYGVKTRFDKAFGGLACKKPVTELRFLRKLEFLAPGRELVQFVDLVSVYQKRKQPLKLEATLSYRDREGRRFEDRIVHDLRAYLELGQAGPSC